MSNTQYNHKRKCKEIIDDIFSSARIFHFSHKGILDQREERLFQHNSWRRLAGIRKNYLFGYMDARFSELYKEMEWAVYHPEFGHIKRKDYDIIDGRWHELIPGGGMHFWKGTWYPYTYPEDDNIPLPDKD